jgi:hydroxylaminobenzene mutase
MNSSIMLSRQSHRLLQIGLALILFLSLEGFAIPYLAAPRLGLSVHTLSAQQSVLLLALGLLWPKLNLGATQLRIAFWLLVYSTFAISIAYVLSAVWGAGNETMPLAARVAHGSAPQEALKNGGVTSTRWRLMGPLEVLDGMLLLGGALAGKVCDRPPEGGPRPRPSTRRKSDSGGACARLFADGPRQSAVAREPHCSISVPWIS